MSLVTFAETELDGIGMRADDTEPMNAAMRKHILLMVQTFADEGHSGMSAQYAIQILSHLLKFEPLAPLTGEDAEWEDVSHYSDDLKGTLYQNRRCSRVFKDATGAWDVDGEVLVHPDGWTSAGEKVIITFPYTPVTRYKQLDEMPGDLNDYFN